MGEASVLKAAPHGENQNIYSIMNHKQNLHNIYIYIYIYLYISVKSTGRVLLNSAMAKLHKGNYHNVMYWHRSVLNVGQWLATPHSTVAGEPIKRFKRYERVINLVTDYIYIHIYDYMYIYIHMYWLCNSCFSFPFHFPFWWLRYCNHLASKLFQISISFQCFPFQFHLVSKAPDQPKLFSHLFTSPLLGAFGGSCRVLPTWFDYFFNSRFYRKNILLLLDLIWIWEMFQLKWQERSGKEISTSEWKWQQMKGTERTWKNKQ